MSTLDQRTNDDSPPRRGQYDFEERVENEPDSPYEKPLLTPRQRRTATPDEGFGKRHAQRHVRSNANDCPRMPRQRGCDDRLAACRPERHRIGSHPTKQHSRESETERPAAHGRRHHEGRRVAGVLGQEAGGVGLAPCAALRPRHHAVSVARRSWEQAAAAAGRRVLQKRQEHHQPRRPSDHQQRRPDSMSSAKRHGEGNPPDQPEQRRSEELRRRHRPALARIPSSAAGAQRDSRRATRVSIPMRTSLLPAAAALRDRRATRSGDI